LRLLLMQVTNGSERVSSTKTRPRQASQIPPMVPHNSSRFETAFCFGIEARDGTTTGISAADRACTVLAAINPATRPSDLIRPGHIFPLRAKSAGVLARAGQTEAAVDLARLAGLHPVGVICEIMNKGGTMAQVPRSRTILGSRRAG
jgi:3,4-dihydroxy 2-butanone 4-phosphate synthase / GTP cyclohydrolase II